LRTRTLTILGVTAAAVGIAATLAGLHPDAPKIILRGGIVLTFAATLPILAAQARKGAAIGAEQLAAAHNQGYTEGLMHAALGLLDPPPSGGSSVGHRPAEPTSYARGHLRAISTTERNDHERTADQ
jgi:hypothetical protein